MLKKIFKSTAFTVTLIILLTVSLFFNFWPETPLYSISALYPISETTSEVRYAIDTERNREETLRVLNVMWAIESNERRSAPELSGSSPDLIVWRNIPSWGALERIYNIFFLEDGALVYSGSQEVYDGQECYILDEHSAEVFKEYLNYEGE